MTVKIALAGNPNCGKTTIFNALTGSNQYVGNWPGVTVEKKEGTLKYNSDVIIMDLPGIYSLSPYTLEEVISRKYLILERPDVILNVIDGTNIERNLYLTTQLLELGIPVVILINMADILKKQGDVLNLQRFSDALSGCPVFEASALKNDGISQAVDKAIELAQTDKNKKILRPLLFSPKLEETLAFISHKLSREIPDTQKRFFAIKIFERDKKINELINSNYIPNVEDIIKKTEKTFNDDSESIITNERYAYITSIIKNCYIRKSDNEQTLSEKIDLVLTNRFAAIPIFIIVMFVMYFVSVTTVGSYVTDWMNDGIFGEGWSLFGNWIPGIPVIVESFLSFIGTADWLNSLIIDGIIGGVGAVLGFVPQLMVLFIFLAFLEGCGYMSRVAFIMDEVFRKFGLSGKSFIPILIGTGCGVPGIMASRTIENPADRKMTIITTTFIPCGAKLPVIALFSGALFGGAWWVAPSAYLLGISAIVVSGIILKKTSAFSGDDTPFVMELPPYHMPTATNVLRSMWDRSWSFIKKAGTVILISTIIIWFLSNLGFENGNFGFVNDFSNGLLSYIGRWISWIFIPLGFGSWRETVATLTGLIAKENIVSTLAVLFDFSQSGSIEGSWGILTSAFTPLSAYSFLAFNLLCAPCCAAMAAIAREMNNKKWTAFAILYQTGFAYIISLCIYQLGSFIAYGTFNIYTFFAVIAFAALLYAIFRKNRYKKSNEYLNEFNKKRTA